MNDWLNKWIYIYINELNESKNFYKFYILKIINVNGMVKIKFFIRLRIFEFRIRIWFSFIFLVN